MATKKKTTAIPKLFVGTIPNQAYETQTQVVTPPYEDEGIKYQGKSKLYDGKNWLLKNQEPFLKQIILYTGHIIEDIQIPVNFKYLCVTLVSYKTNVYGTAGLSGVQLEDRNEIKNIFGNAPTSSEESQVIDCSSAPIKFYGQISANAVNPIAAGVYYFITIIGFYQE